MKTKKEMLKWGKEVAESEGFDITEVDSVGVYYEEDKVRNVIYKGNYEDKSAILKVYDDPRFTDEPAALKRFNKQNGSKKIFASEVYSSKIIDPHKGWIIMEKIPDEAKPFESPLNEEERRRFLEAFVEYRKNFPKEATRPNLLVENLSPEEFHHFRMQRWLELANNKEFERELNGEEAVLDKDKFILRYREACKHIKNEFSQRKMEWCHGHFKPPEVFWVEGEEAKFYLLDFAHTKYYPEGYELGLTIWADVFMDIEYDDFYKDWQKRVTRWLNMMEEVVVPELEIEDFNSLIRATLLERIMGTVMADITASDVLDREEQQRRIKYLFKLFDYLKSRLG